MKRSALAIAISLAIWTTLSVSTSSTSSIGSLPGDALSGGDTTVFDDTRNAFSLPARNLREDHRPDFFVGNSFFNQNWVIAPASVAARDGLGPLFNARSCSGCHFKDGRGRPPEAGQPMETMLLRISIPGADEHGGPLPDTVYGDQIQGLAVPGIPAEGDVVVKYTEVAGTFADGAMFSLRRPAYEIRNAGYGPLSPELLISARVAPGMVGLGLLEAIPLQTIEQMSDPEDADHDGISGRLNRVWDVASASLRPGRFGWKAEQPSVSQQTAGAFAGDIGITSRLHPLENHTPGEKAASHSLNGGTPELNDDLLRAVVLYARSLAVPAARTGSNTLAVRGRDLFTRANCVACHRPELRTGSSSDLPELSSQTIRPYTDLLLHDMGDGLSDGRPAFEASGREWRTPPLWGLGLVGKVNGHTFLLHDGRARNVLEAILWHGGEAKASREHVRAMPKADREALVAFLESL